MPYSTNRPYLNNKGKKDRFVVILNADHGHTGQVLVADCSLKTDKPLYSGQFVISINGIKSRICCDRIHTINVNLVTYLKYQLNEKELKLLDENLMLAEGIKGENMNELIKVNYEDEKPVVSARELHEFLNLGTHFKDWFPRMTEYGFIESVDYTPLIFEHPQNGQPTKDYAITVEMAKEICMLQRNEKGKQARTYFINLEKQWNSPEQVMSRALKIADKTITQLKEQNTLLQPKADFYDAVTGSKTTCDLSVVAKTLNYKNIGRNTLFEILRKNKVLDNRNMPYQKYVDYGWFRVIESSYQTKSGDTHVNFKTVAFQRGLDGISKLLNKAGYERIEKVTA